MFDTDLEWKLTYVGSAQSDSHDQELDSLLVGPIPVGVNKFAFEANPPDTSRIPIDELLGVTVVLLTCCYDGREFVRVGYYVNNEYESEELANNPPPQPIIERIRRNVLAEKPRVTRFNIKWYVYSISYIHPPPPNITCRDSEATAPAEFPPDQPEADLVADEEEYGADELAEEEAETAEIEAEAGGDTTMDGVEGAEGDNVDEDELSDEGSVDIEGESDDELEEEEGEGEGDVADGDEMEVDDKPAPAIGQVPPVH